MKTRSYKKVSEKAHNYINQTVSDNGLKNQGEAIERIVNDSLILKELGLDSKIMKKIRLANNILSKENQNGENIPISSMFERVINELLHKAVKVSEIEKDKVIEDKSINSTGSARVRINHFVELIKEHNTNSPNTLKITQTLLANGLTSGNKNRQINLSKIMVSDISDKEIFVTGTNANRAAIKAVLTDNQDFERYNNSLSGLSKRSHNIKSIRKLER